MLRKIFFSFIVFLFASSLIIAQQTENKVVITTKITDKDGNVTTKEIILEGKDAENFNIDDYMPEKEEGTEVEINVNVEKITTDSNSNGDEEVEIILNKEGEIEGLNTIKVITIEKDGDNVEDIHKIILDNENIPDDIKNKIKHLDIDISEEGGKVKILKFENADEFEVSPDGQKRILFIESSDDLPKDLDIIIENCDSKWIGSNNQTYIINDEALENKAFLGIWPGDDSEQGVILGGVIENSAAEKAGLQEGDIITEFEGKKVVSFSELAQIIRSKKIGDSVRITYIRDGQQKETSATLGESKAQKERTVTVIEHPMGKPSCSPSQQQCCVKNKKIDKPMIGIMIEETENRKGIKIVEVNRADNTLQIDDIVTKFEKLDVANTDQLIAAVNQKKPGDKVKIHFIRDGKKKKANVVLLGRTVKACCSHSCCSSDKTVQKIEKKIIIKKSSKENEEEKIIKSDIGNARLELENIELFPNPNDGTFKLNFNSSTISPISISITDASGKEIIKDEINDFNGTYTGEFNLKGNTPGIYFVNINQDGKVLTKKVVLK